MTEALVVALVGAGAAVLGGLLTAFGTRSVEKLRFQQAVEEKTAERKLAAVVRFTNAAFSWFDWLVLMAEQGLDEDVLTQYNERSRERQQAYRELQLVCSSELFQWLRENYDPLEYRVRAEFGTPVRWGRPPPSEETAPLLREYREMLYMTLIDRFRPEIRPLQATSVSVEFLGTRLELRE
jgi:hypothetical protein